LQALKIYTVYST